MLRQHHGHRRPPVIALHVGHSTLVPYALSQSALGLILQVVITPVVITLVLMTLVLMTPVLHPHERRAATECVLIPLQVWSLPPLHFL